VDSSPAISDRDRAYSAPRADVCESGEWICSLSRQSNLPLEIDDTVDASHHVLPLAILRAFVEARRRSNMACEPVRVVPQLRPMDEHMICCDNFA